MGCKSSKNAGAVKEAKASVPKPVNESLFVVSKLPDGAEMHAVRNVYDGDTLTLADERRVRFLGIDTPELKEKQPFAEEAKALTKLYCAKEVYIAFEPGGKREDHYGRLLAHVYAAHPENSGKFVYVNAAQLAHGLASFYAPSSSEDLSTRHALLHCQQEARQEKRGMWKNVDESKAVLVTVFGIAYHHHGGSCKHLAKTKKPIKTTIGEALDDGKSACRECLGE